YGATWTTPNTVTSDASKQQFRPWISFSSTGLLGMSWRQSSAGAPFSSPYDVWMALSHDGGSTFSTPQEVSNGFSPTPYNVAPGGFNGQFFGDDVGWITFDSNDKAYVAWADWRVHDTQGNPSRQGFLSIIDNSNESKDHGHL